jgi:hypothetical protein
MSINEQKNLNLKSTKKDLLDAYEKLKKELEEKENQTLNAEKKIEEKRKEIIVKKAAELVHENIPTKISSLKVDINNVLNDLLEKLSKAVKEYDNIDEALKIKERELKEIYEIEKSALTLASLIEAYNRKNIELENEYKEKKNLLEIEIKNLKDQWAEEKLQHEKLVKENDEEFRKETKRKKEEFEYTFNREKEQKVNALNDELNKIKKEIEITNEDFEVSRQLKEKELSEKEQKIAEKENYIKKLEEAAADFPAKLDKEVSNAIKQTELRLTSEYEIKQNLLKSEYEGKLAVLNTKIESLEKTLSEQNKQMEALIKQHEKAYAQVQQIAISAVQGAADKNTQTKFEQILEKMSKLNNLEK